MALTPEMIDHLHQLAEADFLPTNTTIWIGRAKVTGLNCNALVKQSQSEEHGAGVGEGWRSVLVEVWRVWEEG